MRMYCQWCGQERDTEAHSVHHCGPKERPPAYCMGCGASLGAGAAECAACGTPAGQLAKVAPPVAVVVAAAEEPGGSGPAVGTATALAGAPVATKGASQPQPQAPPQSRPRAASVARSADEPDTYARGLRRLMLGASAIATLAFFIPWTIGSAAGGSGSGITAVEETPTHWWNPTTPDILFALLLIALLLSIVNLVSDRTGIAAVIALLGLLAAAISLDYLWLARSYLSIFTGYWLVPAGSVVLFASAAACVAHARRART